MNLIKSSLESYYRPCVAIVIINNSGKVLWCRRVEHDGWQFPQGGIDKGESPREAILRETEEEVGLSPTDIEILHETKDWFKYEVPKNKRPRYFRKNIYKGQKQKWFLAKLVSNEKKIKLNATRPIEFDNWLWSTYWYPLSTVVDFKREVYREALISILPEYNKQTSKA